MPKYTSAVTKARVVDLRNAGKSFPEIGDRLGISHSTASRIYKAYHETEDFEARAPKSGRPRKLTDRGLHTAIVALARDPKSSVASIQRDLFPELHPDTLRKHLHDAGIKARTPRPVPLLSEKATDLRLAWAKHHSLWKEADWHLVTFSDESNFKIFNSNGRIYVWRRDGEALDPRYTKKQVKHGGVCVSVWGIISAHGVGPLVRIRGTLTKEKYVVILADALPEYLSSLPIRAEARFQSHYSSATAMSSPFVFPTPIAVYPAIILSEIS